MVTGYKVSNPSIAAKCAVIMSKLTAALGNYFVVLRANLRLKPFAGQYTVS